jgi:hypothetical protein
VVNTAAGDETTLAEQLIAPVARPQRVLIVGGGPAGMEAARIAATAGHHVILAEAMPGLGGLTNVYRHAPRMGTIGDITGWLEQEVYRLGVEVRLSSWLDADDIIAEGADSVILAIGADLDPVLRQVQFPADEIVIEAGARVISSIELFTERADRGRSAVVVDEVGHYEAIASAEYLLEQGVAVTFVTRHKMFAPGIDITLRTQSALERLYAKGDFTLRVGTQLVAARPGSVDLRPQFGTRVETVSADTLVWVPIRPGEPALAAELEVRGVTPLCIGDMLAGRNLQTAIREGHLAARGLGSRAIVRAPEPVDA